MPTPVSTACSCRTSCRAIPTTSPSWASSSPAEQRPTAPGPATGRWLDGHVYRLAIATVEHPSGGAPTRYGRGAATLHWVSAILIIVMLVQGVVMTKMDDGDIRTLTYQLHVSLGYIVLILSVVRVWWARRDRRPDPLEMPAAQGTAFRSVHYLLVLGAALTATSGIVLLIGSGIVPVAPMVDPADVDRSLAVRNAHWLFALGLLVLLVAHLAGGLLYQRLRGRTFGRMRWPRQSPDARD